MASDWDTIRKLLNAALDACEEAERLNITEQEWSATFDVGDRKVSVWDVLQSAWRYPENLRDSLVRARHFAGQDRLFVDDLERTLKNVATLASELIGMSELDRNFTKLDPYHSERETSARELVNNLINFYTQHAIPGLREAIAKTRSEKA